MKLKINDNQLEDIIKDKNYNCTKKKIFRNLEFETKDDYKHLNFKALVIWSFIKRHCIGICIRI